jgi:hypothetical protein
MNIFGWIFMIVSLSCIIALNVYCYSRILKEPEEDL